MGGQGRITARIELEAEDLVQEPPQEAEQARNMWLLVITPYTVNPFGSSSLPVNEEYDIPLKGLQGLPAGLGCMVLKSILRLS